MNFPDFRRSLVARLLAVVLATLAAATSAAAQGAGATLTGTVANGGTGQFLTSAEVSLAGTSRTTMTDREGRFRFPDLAAGTYQLEVSYAGLDRQQRTVTLAPEIGRAHV